MAKNSQQDKSDQVDNTEQPDQREQDAGVEQTDTVEQPETTEQQANKQKPEKGNTTMVTEKEVSKIPEFVKVRVTQGYNLFHPYSNKCVTTELQEFPCDNWILAQLRAGYVELYTVTNKSLLWEDSKLVYAE